MVLPFMQDSLWEHCAPILAIQLCHFSNRGSQLVKDETLVSCTQTQLGQYLTVPITIEGEVSFINKYSLIATINHSGDITGLVLRIYILLVGICAMTS